ncbi:MAG TPA: hypothetical protein PLZ57_12385 [Pseudobdellovibrionaceae bacterium]|nr:hypothetical protein [Pseudobdellovibrionaceae bacterium]
MILSPTGGLVYHLRAWRHRHLWSATRAQVSDAVSTWLTNVFSDPTRSSAENSPMREASGRLAIFGPSAAYLLDFEKVFGPAPHLRGLRIIDPDPIARLIWKLRWRRLPQALRRRIDLSFDSRADILPWWSPQPHALRDDLHAHRIQAVLFFGLLGQIELLSKTFLRPTASARQALQDCLEAFPWASLHDVWSWPNPSTQIDHDTQWLNSILECQHSSQIEWTLTPRLRHELSFRSHEPRWKDGSASSNS